MVELFLNKTLNITLIESLPKEKTAILGGIQLSLAKYFLRYATRESESEPLVMEHLLSIKEALPITYHNQRLLSPNPESLKILPECFLEISISRPILTPQIIQSSIFATFILNDLLPVPDEWNVKEINEKDLNSSNSYLRFLLLFV